jgi:hypothetical protein
MLSTGVHFASESTPMDLLPRCRRRADRACAPALFEKRQRRQIVLHYRVRAEAAKIDGARAAMAVHDDVQQLGAEKLIGYRVASPMYSASVLTVAPAGAEYVCHIL